MNILQQVWAKFQKVAEASLDALEGGIDYVAFESELKEELNSLGRAILAEVLEAQDAYLKDNRACRAGWQIERKGDEKAILTPFGEVRYRRTYYRHTETQEYAHLVDRLAGHSSHARVDALVKAEVVELSTELSYRKSGKEPQRRAKGVVISGQAVMEAVHGCDLEEEHRHTGDKRKCRVLYIEADEDHVAGQAGGIHIPRLVYVHEGKEEVAKERWRLKGLHHFAGIYPDPEELWHTVWRYVEEHYDTDALEVVFLCGDGDVWIKSGLKILPGSVFVIDLYHLDKYLASALGRGSKEYRQAWAAVKQGDRVRVRAIIRQADKDAPTPEKRKAAVDLGRYMRNNWDGVMAYRLYPDANLGVSAEGHVSHVLSARLSSRPLAWSRLGVDKMARLRAMRANGVCVRERYLALQRSRLQPIKVSTACLAQQRQNLKKAVGEVSDNLPALRGPVTQLRRALKGLADLTLIS